MIFIEIIVIFILPGLAIISVIYDAIAGPGIERKIKEETAQRNAERADCQRRDKESREKAVKEFNESYRAWLLTNPSFEEIERFKFQAIIRLKLADIENAIKRD